MHRVEAAIPSTGRAAWTVLVLLSALIIATPVSCKPGHQGVMQDATEGIWTGTDGQDSESADTTDGESPFQGCIDSSSQGLTGTKHWCWGEYDIDVDYVISHPLDIPGPVQRGIGMTAVSLANDSTYDDPFAMACCSDITETGWLPGDDTCSLAHHEACYSDVVEHVCELVRTLLAENKQQLGSCSEDAVEGAIRWLRNGGYGDPETKGSGEQQCYDFFWLGQGLVDADYCAEAQSFFSEVTWSPGKSFSGCLGSSVVENLEITISLFDIHPTAPPPDAHSCTGPEENDGLSPPLGSLLPDSVGSFALYLIPVDVIGPEYGGEFVTGTGTFGSSSAMAHHLDANGDLVIDRWQMVGAEPASVGTSSIPMEVARFRLSLVGSRVARLELGRWTLGQGDALFHLYGSAGGAGEAIDVVNTTPIEILVLAPGDPSCESQAGCLVSEPFTVEHLDALGELWQLDVGEGHWAQ